MKPVIVILSVCLAVSVIANVAFVLVDQTPEPPSNVKQADPTKSLSTNDTPRELSDKERGQRAEWLNNEIKMRKSSLGDLDVIKNAAQQDRAVKTIKLIDSLKRAKAEQLEIFIKEQGGAAGKESSPYSPTSFERRKMREDMLKKQRSLRPPPPTSEPKPSN